MSIQPLPSDVVAQIKSSIMITSLNGVIYELIKNSLDADATKLDISIDYSRGSCSVEDDGIGILPSEFGADGHLGKVYHTSKVNPQTELHGGRGTFLASLSAMALVTITSRHNLYRSHNALTLHKTEVVSRQTPAPSQQHLTSRHGSRVTIRDLFGNMPVRVKQRALVAEKERGSAKDWELLKRDVIALLLPWPKTVAVTIRDSQTNQKLNIRPSSMPFQSTNLSVSSLCGILHHASFIDHDEKRSWISVRASTPSLDISGAISLNPSPTKHVQFLSIGIQPLLSSHGQGVFYDEINRLFANSAFGIEEQAEEIDRAELERRAKDGRYKGDGYTLKELKLGKKGVDRWPMFFIRVQSFDLRNSKVQTDEMDEKAQSLPGIIEVLRVMVFEFLTKHHFRPKGNRGSQKRTEFDDRLSENPHSAPHPISSRPPQTIKSAHSQVKRSVLKRKHQPDILGTKIKLPSFRQGVPAMDHTFDFWARVKSGTPMRSSTLKPAFSAVKAISTSRPSTAHASLSDVPTISNSSRREIQVAPLISKEGKIARAPFGDVTVRAKPPRAATVPEPLQTSISDTAPEYIDDVVAWVNPITKVKSLVNQRTGLTVRANNISSFTGSQLRLTASRPNKKPLTASPSPWISDMLNNWDNPIFGSAEPSIPQVSFEGPDATAPNFLNGRHHHCSQEDIDLASKEISSGIHRSISKSALEKAEVISQVDQKFILARLQSNDILIGREGGSILVLIDQHAADERIRVEALMEELCSPPLPNSGDGMKPGILSTALVNSLHYDLSAKETHLLGMHQAHFANWGILYTISAPTGMVITAQRLTVHSLPPLILERCQSSPRLLIDLIRTELHITHSKPAASAPIGKTDWLRRIHNCPQGLLDMINSRACRSAIMFNDVLSKEQCETLLRRLAKCKFPFQCAHGRPSLVPLVGLGALGVGGWDADIDGIGNAYCKRGDVMGFGRNFMMWKDRLRKDG